MPSMEFSGLPGRFERGGALANQLADTCGERATSHDLSGYPNQIAAVSLAAKHRLSLYRP